MNHDAMLKNSPDIYTTADLARDLGSSISPALELIVTNVFAAETVRWIDRLQNRDGHLKAQHDAEVAQLKEQLAEAAFRANQREREIERLNDQIRRYNLPMQFGVTIPHTGRVPAVLQDVTGQLFRIRWEQGQPSGEGEPWSVPPGWVLHDDQSGTWLDYINTRHCTGL
jgi:hypothetical protein